VAQSPDSYRDHRDAQRIFDTAYSTIKYFNENDLYLFWLKDIFLS